MLRKYFGYTFYNKRFIFICPCRSIISSDHQNCKKYYSQQQFINIKEIIYTALSKLKLSKVLKLKFNHDLIISTYELNLYLLNELKNNDLLLLNTYYINIPIFFKYDYNKILKIKSLTLNNESTSNIDRSNIDIKINQYILAVKLSARNLYYYQRQQSLDKQIEQYYSNSLKYQQFEVHQYELNNKIDIPIQNHSMNPTPSYPTKFPTNFIKYNKFINDTSNYILPMVQYPSGYNPYDIKHTRIIQDFFHGIPDVHNSGPPLVSYQKVVTEKMKLFPNKKYLLYEKYKDVLCHFCRKKGHIMKICEDLTPINNIKNPLVKKLAEFIMIYPTLKLNQKFKSYSDIILDLPEEYDLLRHRRDKFWSDFGYDNPFSDTFKYWGFGDYRRRDVGYNYALGANRVTLLKLVCGYESKFCMAIPRMRLSNHQSWDTSNPRVVELLSEYLELGILRIIPERLAKVILPMSVIIKPDKIRIVVDARPVNIYIPSMKFKPDSVEDVKKLIFPLSLFLGQDGKHAFYQMPVSPLQALYQCVRFFFPPMGIVITCAFCTEIFGSSLSCRRFVMQEQQINKYFRSLGIQMAEFYDDSFFLSQNHRLFAGVLGSFIKRVYYHVGRQLREHKTDLLYGKYECKFRGFLWNSKKMKVKPLNRLLISTKQKIDNLVKKEHKYLMIREYSSIIGKLSYTNLVIPYMSILLSPCKDIMRFYHKKYGQDIIWSQKLYVSNSMCNHLLYLWKILKNHHESNIIVGHIDLEIVTDASDRLMASYDSDKLKVIVPLNKDQQLSSSTYRETLGIYIALLNRVDKIKNKTVRVLVDNLGTSTIVMRNGSKISELNQIVYAIIKLCMDHNIYLWTRWLRRSHEAIQFADDLSKSTESDRWIFDRKLLKSFLEQLQLSFPAVDLLADYPNKLCEKYYSRFKDLFSLGCNWLQADYQQLKNKILYLNPPFRGDYLSIAINHIISKQLTVYVLLPKWSLAAWYNQVLTYADIIIEIPEGYQYFTSPDYMTTRLTKKWDILFVVFGLSFQNKAYYKYNKLTMKISKLLLTGF